MQSIWLNWNVINLFNYLYCDKLFNGFFKNKIPLAW